MLQRRSAWVVVNVQSELVFIRLVQIEKKDTQKKTAP